MANEITIHEDSERKMTWLPGQLVITSYANAGKSMTVPVRALISDAKIQPKTIKMLKQVGKNPADYLAIYRLGSADLVTTKKIAEKVVPEAQRLEKEYETECRRIRNLPENRERNEIDRLYAEANRIERGTSDDNVMVPAQLRGEARRKMVEWQAKYPESAKKEQREELMTKAASLRSKAIGALTYDADGWISSGEQQKRHDEYIAEAEKIERQAAHI